MVWFLNQKEEMYDWKKKKSMIQLHALHKRHTLDSKLALT